MKQQIQDYDHGLEIITGLMGSGKSYFATKRTIETISKTRRPVYTNLPLKFPVVRQRLRSLGGKELASLIHPLTETHWRTFLRRRREFSKLLEYYSKIKPKDLTPVELEEISKASEIEPSQIKRMKSIHSNHLHRLFVSRHGESVYEGPQANDIPPFAIIVVDEIQNWHPMAGQSKDPDRIALLDYITKSRHSVHWLWIITQDPANISIEFRRLAKLIWSVRSVGEDKLAWNFKLKNLGINATGYRKYTHDQWEHKERSGDESAETFLIFRNLPWNRRVYRYYHSYTNAGSKRQLERQLRKAREEAGLNEDGETEKEVLKKQIHKVGIASKITNSIVNKFKLILIVVLAFAFGKSIAKNKEVPIQQGINSNEANQIQWPRWTITGAEPWIGNKQLQPGDTLSNGAEFMYSDPATDSIVLVHDGAFWLWEYGQTEPVRIAPQQDVRDAVNRAISEGALDSASLNSGG